MATNFPNSIDVYVNPTNADTLKTVAVKHSTQHGNLNDAVLALEHKLGVNLSSETYSIDYITTLFLLTQTEHAMGRYKEVTYSPTVKPLPTSITWYVDASKTVKLVEKIYTYGHPVIKVIPTSIVLRLYDGSNNLLRTITDTVYYTGISEASRTRVVT